MKQFIVNLIDKLFRNGLTNHLFTERENRAVRDAVLRSLGLYSNPSKWVELK